MKRQKTTVLRRELTRQFYKGNKLAFSLVIVKLVCMVAGHLMISWLLQVLIDLTTGVDTRYSLTQVFLLALLSVGILIFCLWMGYLGTPRFLARAVGQYRQYVFEKISRKGIAAFSGENTSFYISALSNDVAVIESGYLRSVFGLFADCCLFFGALAMMLWYSPLLTGIAVALALLPVAASILTGNRMAKAEEEVSRKNDAFMSTLHDSLTGFSVVKSFKAEAAMCRLFAQRIQEVSRAKTLREKMSILVEGMAAVAGVIAQLGVFLAGAVLAMGGYGISGGMLVVFVQLMNFVIAPIGSVPQCLANRKAACALMDKLANALEENVRQEGLETKNDLTTGISVRDVCFGYEPGKQVLHHVSFDFEAGKSYAIVGASGSGKSTLLNLLMAAYDGYSGEICYDDLELRGMDTESLYELVSVVQQNVFIFNASIRENITMFADFPKEEVDQAVKLSGLSSLIALRGEDYLCGENGSGLSGGEKQRISIARSLLKKSRVLLVDEATAALDAQTAFQVANAILDLRELTRIVVTHALEEGLLRRYDCILAMKNGTLVESGSFEELMEKKGYFYSLFTVYQ